MRETSMPRISFHFSTGFQLAPRISEEAGAKYRSAIREENPASEVKPVLDRQGRLQIISLVVCHLRRKPRQVYICVEKTVIQHSEYIQIMNTNVTLATRQ